MDNPYIILLDSEAFMHLIEILAEIPEDERKRMGLYYPVYLADEQHLCTDDGWPHWAAGKGEYGDS